MNAHNGFAARERQLARGEQIAWQPGMDLSNWFPVTASIADADGTVTLAWRDMQDIAFTDSFFENTMARQPHAERRVCHAPPQALDQFQPGNALAPDAFIFHVSRCGSTLLTQLLASLPQAIVMSEPSVIDSLLRLHHDLGGKADTVTLLRQAMLAMGQRRNNTEDRYFIKFDCWHIHSLPLLRQAFPGTPCLFLYRQPQAVLASHQRRRGPQMVPGLIHPALLPLQEQQLAAGDLDAYTALVLDSLFAAAQRHAAAGDLTLVNYDQLPEVLFSSLLGLLAIDCTPGQLDTMRARARFHSKDSGIAYCGEARAPQEDRLTQLATGLATGYQALELLRATAPNAAPIKIQQRTH